MDKQSANNFESSICSHFPDYRIEIHDLLQTDSNFRELAEDYLFCVNETKQISLTNNERLTQQYEETLQDLEEELLAYLTIRK